MVYIDPEFEVPTIPEEERYEGTEVDPNVLAALPGGTRVLWSATHGASFWAISTKIDTEDAEGQEQSYFMKNVPRPIALGVLAKDPSKHFLTVEFKDMIEQMPRVPELVAVMAKLHKESVSPEGKFGFQAPTSQSLQLENSWCDTWEEFFTRAFRGTVRHEQEIQGVNEELQRLADETSAKVIPRLLRPMESGGRRLKPTLVHGDLWHGNMGIDMVTGQVVLYDCCAFYGHNEYDLGMFRAARYRTTIAHVRAYHKLVDISYPQDDRDDRNALYALRVDLEVSCGWPANKRMRLLAMEEMKRLIEKYPRGFEGWEEQQAAKS